MKRQENGTILNYESQEGEHLHTDSEEAHQKSDPIKLAYNPCWLAQSKFQGVKHYKN